MGDGFGFSFGDGHLDGLDLMGATYILNEAEREEKESRKHSSDWDDDIDTDDFEDEDEDDWEDDDWEVDEDKFVFDDDEDDWDDDDEWDDEDEDWDED